MNKKNCANLWTFLYIPFTRSLPENYAWRIIVIIYSVFFIASIFFLNFFFLWDRALHVWEHTENKKRKKTTKQNEKKVEGIKIKRNKENIKWIFLGIEKSIHLLKFSWFFERRIYGVYVGDFYTSFSILIMVLDTKWRALWILNRLEAFLKPSKLDNPWQSLAKRHFEVSYINLCSSYFTK